MFFDEVAGQVYDADEEEAGEVAAEAFEGIALEGHGTAIVVGHVIFGVMHADVMAVVGFGSLAEEGANYPGEVMVHETIFLFEEDPVAGAVEH